MSLFNLDIHFNSDGWGPVAGEKIPAFSGVPYAHFDKKDKIGRAADFVSQNYQNQRQPRRGRFDEMATDFAYRHDAVEDSTFQLVDTINKPGRKNNMKRQNGRLQQTGRGGRGTGRGGRSDFGGRGGRGGGRKPFNRRRIDRKIDRSPSVVVGELWETIDEFDLSQLLKLAANTPVVEDLLWAGSVNKYDELYDKVSARNFKTIRRCEDKVFHYVTTSDDPILQGFAVDNKANVYITDSILSHLMASPKSVYSWDIVVQKLGDMIFFDKRNDSTLDVLTVNETSLDSTFAPEELEDFNQPEKLAEEATAINQNFSQQVVGSEKKSFEPNPFVEEEDEAEPASVAYRYRLFTLGDLKIASRCELHSWTNKRGQDEYMNVYALNDWDGRYSGGLNWRQKVDTQRGAVLANELKNNACKVAKWTAQSILSGADQMKVGYVSRVNAANPGEHVVLATQFFKPKDLAQQINLNINNAWGIVKMLCELFSRKEDGKYVIMKDPNKPLMRIFSVPAHTFEDEEDDVEDEEEEEIEA